MEDMLIEDIGTAGSKCEEEEDEEGGEAAGYNVEDPVTEEEEAAAATQEPPTAIIVTNLLPNTFDDPQARVIFESLFHDVDKSVTFQYFRSFRRVRVNFASHAQASTARDNLHMTEFNGEVIKCYFTQPIILGGNREGGPHLKPPKREKQFLISPPASPPVGWEPIDEAEPLINYDLISAVAQLVPGEAHELHPAMEDKPGIIVHVCEESLANDEEQGGARRRISPSRRPTPCPTCKK
ncbi:calcipressin-1-like [Procambarus clarkii]|uniref:calcipressin-1-like n=1 Tax=Procambarus clarkii TaxID=6728 RepID=UPI003741FDA0